MQTVDFGNGRVVTLARNYTDVIERVRELLEARQQILPQLIRTSNVMDGGERAVAALLGDHAKSTKMREMPIANYIRDASEAFASRLQAIPALKVDPPATGRKSDQSASALKNAEKRARIVTAYDDDEADGIAERMPMLARWVPGASYAVWTIDPCMRYGYPYPKATLRSPIDTMLGSWSSTTQPEDCGFILRIPLRELHHLYPEHKARLPKWEAGPGTSGGVLMEGNKDSVGVDVVKYYDRHGTWIVIPQKGLLLDFIPNPLESGPAFVAFTKFNYGRLRGEYDDMFGPMIAMARLQILSEISVRKDVAQPTNLYTGAGGAISGPYKQGFNAVNIFDPNARVEIPSGSSQFQAWQQLDRLERQLRIEGSSPLQDSGESPMSFVTGRGMNALADRVERSVKEYHIVFRTRLQTFDARRLEYDEKAWPDIRKPMSGVRDGSAFSETYTPSKDIRGNYRTRREYGAMAAVDEAVKLNGMMLMTQANPPWVSTQWVRSQLNDLGVPVTQIEQQIRQEEAERSLNQYIMSHASTPESPEHLRALRLLIDDLPEGEKKRRVEQFLGDMEAAQREAEQAAAGQEQQMAGPQPSEQDVLAALTGVGGGGGATPTTLARVTQGGSAEGGTQVIAGGGGG